MGVSGDNPVDIDKFRMGAFIAIVLASWINSIESHHSAIKQGGKT